MAIPNSPRRRSIFPTPAFAHAYNILTRHHCNPQPEEHPLIHRITFENDHDDREVKIVKTFERLKKIQALEKEAMIMNGHLTDTLHSVGIQDASITDLRRDCEDLITEVAKLKSQVAGARLKVLDAQNTVAKAGEDVKQIQKEYNDIQVAKVAADDKIKTIGLRLKSEDSLLEEARIRETELKKQYGDLETELQTTKKELDGKSALYEKLEAKCKAFDKIKQGLIAAHKKLNDQTQVIKEKGVELASAKKMAEESKEQVAKLKAEQVELVRRAQEGKEQEMLVMKTRVLNAVQTVLDRGIGGSHTELSCARVGEKRKADEIDDSVEIEDSIIVRCLTMSPVL